MATHSEPIKPTSTPRSLLGIAILAIALYILLIDAAIETFVSGSPVRWWVAGVVAAYFALSFGLWRYRRSAWEHMSWAIRATESFFLLLALLAFTAWLPGGLTDGIRLLGQPTSRVLSLLTAVVIALAGVSLARRSWPKPWVKWVIGALTAYSLVALGKGIIYATSFPELFHGESFWSWLPRWLQGAFIGALVIVPVEVIARAGRMLKAAPGGPRTWELRQLIAMAMSVVLVISGATTSAYGGPQPSAAQIVQPLANSYQELSEALAGPKPKAPLTPEQVADKLEKLFPMLEKAEREIPRDTFDMQAVINKVGKDPQKLFEWVRDNTYFVPYRGLLRGDKGVLMDRLGNSLDRAMLLYAMLRSIGQPVRLAHGTLTEAQAQNVLKKVRPFPSFEIRTGSTSSTAATDAFIKQYADENHLDAARIRKAMDKLAAQQQRVKELVQKRVAAQAAMIAAAVGPPPKGALAEERANQVRAITDHWWVQWQNGPNWVDLDPTLPDAQPRKTLTAAQATPAPNTYTDLGDDLLHTVQIQVVVEVWKHGQVTEVPVLTQKLLPANLIGVPVVLRQIPVAWPKDLNLFQEKEPIERFKQTVLAQSEWLPVLSVGSQNISRYSFNDYGDLNDSTLPGYVQNVMSGRVLAHKEEEAVQGLGQSIGNMLGGSQAQPKGQQAPGKIERTQVTAEWIEYEISSPSQPNRKIRRDVFDLLGPAARVIQGSVPQPEMTEARQLQRGLAQMGTVEILPTVNDFTGTFVEHVRAASLLKDREELSGLVRNLHERSLQALSGKVSRLPIQLYYLVLDRQEWSRFHPDIYLNSPNIFVFYTHPAMQNGTALLLDDGFDIVANDVSARERPNIDTFLARLEQGVLDTNAEAVMASAGCTHWSRHDTSCGRVRNTAEMFASAEKVPWVAIRDRKDGNWQGVELSQDERARVTLDLDRGFIAMVPERLSTLGDVRSAGWWIIDPKSGHTLGIGDRGMGQAGVEHTAEWETQTAIIIQLVHTYFNLFMCLSESSHNGRISDCDAAKCMAIHLAELLAMGFGGAADQGIKFALITSVAFDFGKDVADKGLKCPQSKE